MYPNSRYSVNPLSFSREDISLRDILGLLTQTTNEETSVRLHNKVYLLLSQLSEPVELQRLSQLIDEENWNDEESTFIALRQTLLTKLEALEEDHPRLPSSSHRQTLVDLRDAVLQRTQLNVVLLNMVLREFLAGNPDKKKLVVVVDNERILEKTSVLSKSLEFISDSGLASVLISTNDPSILSSPICQVSDFIFHTPSNSPLWRKALMKHFLELKVDALVRCPGSYIVFSPFSLHIGRGDGTEPIYEQWNNCCCRVSIEHGNAPTNMGTRGDIEVDANAQSEDHEGHGIGTLSSLPSPPLSNKEGLHRTSTTIHEETQFYNDDDFEKTIQQIEEDAIASLMPLPVELEVSQNSWPPTSTVEVPTPQPPLVEEVERDIVSRFPTQHQPLISAIISLNKPDITAPVEFEQLRKKVGKEVLQTFAWSTFTAFVKVACKEGYIEQWIEPDASVRVKLKFPLPSQSDQANNKSGSTDPNLPPSRPRSTTILSDNHNSLRDILAETGRTPVAPDSTLDMDISSVVSTNDLQPDSKDPPPPSRSNDVPGNNGLPHPVGISPESYPAKFQVLVKAILQLSDNRTNVPVGFEAVRQLVGNKDDIRALNVGFVTFTGMVNQASTEKCVRQEGTESEGKRLALLPPKGAVQTEKLSKKPDPDMYPKQFRPLIRAIFKLSDGCTNVAVDYEATRKQIGTIHDVQALGLGWNSFYEMVKAAVNGKYVEENGKLLTALKVK
ncbi:hypothetical protein CPB86DRAFT_452557 [Serendipita vermifera]|nr:hypothetical protein CPB86DRAFT_452557 [Serendipita vermifera]